MRFNGYLGNSPVRLDPISALSGKWPANIPAWRSSPLNVVCVGDHLPSLRNLIFFLV
ncbi:hypothetical protein D3OALGB2SA_5771 [Olavius algarvensis associated proteobacterium Delta 3]|nr:hypothetical protein D3OALGB2SA_5771 [Olavius algarvensis associated proteobacterium Delta 3]